VLKQAAPLPNETSGLERFAQVLSMQTNAAFRIEKNTVSIDARDTRRELRQVEVFLANGPLVHSRGERLQDVLGERRFLPVRSKDQTEMINTEHLMWVRMYLIDALDELDPELERSSGVSSANVRIELAAGGSIEGTLRYCLPAGSSRLIDYLGTIDRWFPLRTEGSLYLINRDHVIRVVPLAEG
jgi:hypothetical protein